VPNLTQAPPILLARAAILWYAGRIHFPKDRIGEIVQAEEPFRVFRQMTVEPAGDQPKRPGAIFKVCFHYARFSASTNRTLSLIPVPLIAAQPGFRSKIWLLGQETGVTQGLYEWDTVKDAEKYWTSFPMELLKKRSVPESLLYNVYEI
jgi:hypothetical protein